MLDENLPTFFLKGSPNGVKHHEAYYYSQHGSEPEPTYTLKHPDPSMPDGKNVYAAGLFDAFNPEVLYGEVYIKPEWTYPTLSQEEIRRNGGVPPPPQPVLPTEFTIQLYDPDQQVVVKQKSGSWGGTASYEFSMPQNTFRLPSASTLDRSLNDPAADITTPKINFVWKREGKLSKDLSCFMTGKSTDPAKKKRKMKEPDIAVALFRALREVTVYESNLYRVEMEDPKGLEIVLLLAAATIKDLYFGQVNETFNVGEAATRKNTGGLLGRKKSLPLDQSLMASGALPPRPVAQSAPPRGALVPVQRPNQRPTQPSRSELKRQSLPPLQTNPSQTQYDEKPPLDPRAQWEIDAEHTRLKLAQAAEAREQRQAQENKQRERQRSDEAEQRRLRKIVEAEEKQRRKKAAEVDKETERLRRKYGTQENMLPAQRHSVHSMSGPFQRQPGPSRPTPAPQRGPAPQRLSNGLFVQQQARPTPPPMMAPHPQLRPPQPRPQPSGSWHRPAVSQSAYFGGSGMLKPDEGKKLKQPKKSFFGLRSSGDDPKGKLSKKQSSMF